ncbi:hypothetical protein M8J75_002315 [Diaphorina citri]|nr:hypothetical protein M8J75_002315 [Diaphorina citri]
MTGLFVHNTIYNVTVQTSQLQEKSHRHWIGYVYYSTAELRTNLDLFQLMARYTVNWIHKFDFDDTLVISAFIDTSKRREVK